MPPRKVFRERTVADNLYVDPRTGVHYVRKMVDGVRLKRSTGEKGITRARDRAARIIVDLKDGVGDGETPTWEKWIAECEESYFRTKLPSENSRQLYRWAARHALTVRHFARKSIGDITNTDCTRVKAAFQARYKKNTVRTAMTSLSAILGYAVEARVLEHNPWSRIDRPAVEGREKVMTLAEQDALLANIETPWFTNYFNILLGSGLRASEVLSLRRANLLFDRELIDLVDEHGTGTGKGQKRRKVPLLPGVVPHLKAQLDLVGPKAKQLFPFHLHTVQQQFERLGPRADVVGVTAHVLRHTFATRWVEAGEDIYVLSKILGHSSVTITEKLYVHEAPESRIAAAKRVESALGLVAPRRKVVEFPAVAPILAPTRTGTR